MGSNNNMNSMQSSNIIPIQDLDFNKAKKKEGFYICMTKAPFSISFNNSKILAIKDTSNTIIVKSKTMTNYMDELNKHIIDIVRENSQSWFSTSIDEDLIDEYYISTLQYNKKQGETIRLKVLNIEEITDTNVDNTGTLVCILKNLKFYKQKFFPEFEIVSFNSLSHNMFISDDIDSENDIEEQINDEDEELPKPTYEEINKMKLETLKDLEDNRTTLQDKLNKIDEMKKNLKSTSDLNVIIKICEEYHQNILCE